MQSPAHCGPSIYVLRQCLERWTGHSVCELRRQAAHSHIQTSDVCSTLTSRGHSLPLQPPLSLLISAAFSADLSNFLLKACLLGNVSHGERIFWLCNTLIYALSFFFFFFFFAWAFVCERGFIFSSWKDPIQILGLKSSSSLYGFSRLDFFIWQKCASAWFQLEHKRFNGSSLYQMTPG